MPGLLAVDVTAWNGGQHPHFPCLPPQQLVIAAVLRDPG
jgi:hypothetical protein